MIARRKTIPVPVGDVVIGGGQPIAVQSMTSTDTADAAATIAQILELAEAGSELVRITVDRPESARAVPAIIEAVRRRSTVPIVGDFHFNGHILLEKFPEAAVMLDKYRINPGNVGKGASRDHHFEQILEIALRHKKPVRIGVNGGSLDPELLADRMDHNRQHGFPNTDQQVFESVMVDSALLSIEAALRYGMPKDRIIVSAKLSEPQALFRVHRALSRKTDQPIHLGLTEAGGGISGVVASTAAISVLLQEGIGDTIRVSLTPGKEESRAREVEVAREILQVLDLRRFAPRITSCPGCGRTTGNQFQLFTEEVQAEIKRRMPDWQRQYPAARDLRIAVMGCIVNGPGEARAADLGIFFPGKGEGRLATVYVRGQKWADLKGESIRERFFAIIEDYLRQQSAR